MKLRTSRSAQERWQNYDDGDAGGVGGPAGLGRHSNYEEDFGVENDRTETEEVIGDGDCYITRVLVLKESCLVAVWSY